MIKPLDFSKYEEYEVPEFPHSLHYHKDNYAKAVAEWHQINDFITEEFKFDLEDYLMNYLAIELGAETIRLVKIRQLIEIAMDYVAEFDEVLNLCVAMLPLLKEDRL
jgi:hypothetical protein